MRSAKAKMAFRQVVKTGKYTTMKQVLFGFILALGLLPLKAQELKFSAVAQPAKAAEGEQIRVTYSINANASGFTPPDFSAFQVLMGPQQMMSSQFVNGRSTMSLSYTYIISGKKAGKYTLAPASIKVANGLMRSNSIEIEIVKGKPQANAANQGNAASKSNAAPAAGSGDDLFLKAVVSKVSTVVGDQILVTYKLFSRYTQLNYELAKMPVFNGFYSEDIAIAKSANGQRETLNGKEYLTAEVKKFLLFPQKSGKLEIPAMELSCLVRQRANSGSIWDQFWGGGYRDVEVTVKSGAQAIDVREPDPANRPATFNGAVGDLKASWKLDRNQLKSGEAVNLTLSVTGKGNLKLLEPPVLELPAELEVYDPQVEDEITISSAGMNGTRNFEYLIIPRAGGTFAIGPYIFSSYDAEGRKFRNETLQALQLQVEKGSGDALAGNSPGRSGTKPKQLAEDIKYIRLAVPEFSNETADLFFLSLPYFIWTALPLVLWIAFSLWRRYLRRRQTMAGYYRVKEAGSHAGKRLKKASELLQAGQRDAFYEEIYRALNGYLSDKLKLPVAELNRQNISALLSDRKVSDEVIQRLIQTLDQCEFARFAPGASSDMQITLSESNTLIQAIENQLKS